MTNKFKGSNYPWCAFNGYKIDEINPSDVKDESGNHAFYSKTINVASSEGKILCEVKSYTTMLFEDDFDKFTANFNLIVNAPELLQHCISMYNELSALPLNYEETSLLKDALATINKSLGK